MWSLLIITQEFTQQKRTKALPQVRFAEGPGAREALHDGVAGLQLARNHSKWAFITETADYLR